MRAAAVRAVASWRLGSTAARPSRSVSRGAAQPWRRAAPAGQLAAAAAAAAGATALLAGGEARAEGGSGLGATLDSIERRLARIEATLTPAGLDDEDEGPETILNWSATHSVETKRLHQPESLAELEALVRGAASRRRKLRVLGSALSPNGIGFSRDEMVTLSLCDRVLSVDAERGQVTVEAGARVHQVVEALRPHALTLQNYASIAEQQIGGFVQVGAHGTGARLPTVDEMVVRMKLITPARGTIELSATQEPELFALAKVGLGALGVVSEVTLQCVPAHTLLEHTFVRSAAEVRRQHDETLRSNQHVRYMWVPHTDTVVVVTNNPVPPDAALPAVSKAYSDEERLAPFRSLLKEVAPATPDEELESFSFADYRDKLIAHAPLDREHIVAINQAEAEFWKRSEGYALGPSDTRLQFECGGQQWVSEVGFPAGSLEAPSDADLRYMERVLGLIEERGIPAPSPIEQRWTSGSSAAMSIAASASPEDVFSWVGIIMYLPTEQAEERAAITEAFFDYRHACEDALWGEYGAVEHWAKVEAMHDAPRAVRKSSPRLCLNLPRRCEVDGRCCGAQARLRARLGERFPVEAFNAARRQLDPHNILANDVVNELFPL